MSTAIDCYPRLKIGKNNAAALRKQGKIPLVVYGGEGENFHGFLEYRDVKKNFKQLANNIIELIIENERVSAIIQKVEMDGITDLITHLDFLRVQRGTDFITEIPLDYINLEKCPAIKAGGNLNKVKRRLKVKVTPENFIRKIVIDLQNVQLGATIRLQDVNIPEGITLVTKDPKLTIATITGRRSKVKAAAATTESPAEKSVKAPEKPAKPAVKK